MISGTDLQAAMAAILASPRIHIGVRGHGTNGPCSLLVNRTVVDLAYAIQEAGWIYPEARRFEVLAGDSESAPELTAYSDGTPRPPVGSMIDDGELIATIATT